MKKVSLLVVDVISVGNYIRGRFLQMFVAFSKNLYFLKGKKFQFINFSNTDDQNLLMAYRKYSGTEKPSYNNVFIDIHKVQVEKVLKGSLDSISSPSPAGKFT